MATRSEGGADESRKRGSRGKEQNQQNQQQQQQHDLQQHRHAHSGSRVWVVALSSNDEEAKQSWIGERAAAAKAAASRPIGHVGIRFEGQGQGRKDPVSYPHHDQASSQPKKKECWTQVTNDGWATTVKLVTRRNEVKQKRAVERRGETRHKTDYKHTCTHLS